MQQTPDKERFLSGSIWSLINVFASVGIPLLALIYFSNHLKPEEFALIVIALATAETLKAFAPLGLYESLLNHPKEIERLAPVASLILLTSATFLFITYVISIHVMALWMPNLPEHMIVLTLVGVKLFFDIAIYQPQAVLAVRHDFRRLSLRAVVANVASLSVALLLSNIISPLIGLALYYPIQSIIAFMMIVVSAQALRRPTWDPIIVQLLWKEGMPASLVRGTAIAQSYLDQFLLTLLLIPRDLAFYNLGKRIENSLITASSVFASNLLQPIFTQETARPIALRRGLAIMTLICGLPSIVFACNTHAVVAAVFGSAWEAGAVPAAILAISGAVRAVGGVYGSLLTVSGRNSQLVAAGFLTTALGIALVLGGSIVGPIGCAVGVLAKDIALSAWCAGLTRADSPTPFQNIVRFVALPWGAAAIATQGTLWLLLHFQGTPLLDVVVSGVAGSVALGAVLAMQMRDLRG